MNTEKHLLKYWLAALLLICKLSLLQGQVLISNADKEIDQTVMLEQSVQRHLKNDYDRIKPFFEEAYQTYPSLPKGVFEAVSYTYTRFAQMSSDTLESDALSIPRTYSVMGLTLNGKGVFRENLKLVSAMSSSSIDSLVIDDRAAILAYASAFSKLQQKYNCYGNEIEKYLPVFVILSELPYAADANPMNDFADIDLQDSMGLFPLCSSIYAIFSFLSDTDKICFGSPGVPVDFVKLFGRNLSLLRSPDLKVAPKRKDKSIGNVQLDYSGAIWCPAASCNFAKGRSLTPSNVVVHYTSGTYAGSIAWFQNCQASASAHYVIRSMDGQVTQMVSENDRAWHVGNENGYTIGIEHEAYGNVYSYFTPVMYQASANLVRDICQRRPNIHSKRMFYRDTLDNGSVLNSGIHNLGGSSACPQIRGHQHYPAQTHTDPGPYWNWNYYYKLINPTSVDEMLTDTDGILTDSGGETGNYSDDERRIILIHVDNADSIALEFTDFALEADYDFMWIYIGDSPFSTLLGRWNTHSPGRLVVPGGDVLLEFRSDCSGTNRGWRAQWHSYPSSPQVPDEENPATQICWNEEDWVTGDIGLHFQDTDDVNVKYRFYQIIERPNSEWIANPDKGCVCDNFDYSLNLSLWNNDGRWLVENGSLRQPNANVSSSVIAANCNMNASPVFLFDFYLSMDEGDKCSFFFAANSTMLSSNSFCGYSVEFDKQEHSLSLYKTINGITSLLRKQTGVYYTSGQQYLYRICWDRQNGSVKVFRHNALLLSINDFGNIPSFGGNYMGFSTQSTAVTIDNVRSYIARNESLLLTVGNDPQADIQVQARNGVANCKVKSIVMDAADKFSPLVEKSLRVDYTPPTSPLSVKDGLNADVDTVKCSNVVSASWNASEDGESGIAAYQYEISIRDKGSLPKTVTGWTDCPNMSYKMMQKLTYPCQVVVRVKTKNKAGLESELVSSDGVVYTGGVPQLVERFVLTPNPTASSKILLKSLEEDDLSMLQGKQPIVSLFDANGRLIKRQLLANDGEISLDGYPKGIYVLSVEVNNMVLWTGKLLKE